MLKDINNQDNLTFSKDKTIIHINELFDSCGLYPIDSKDKIIGFGKFEPVLDTDNQFCNFFDRNCWCPIYGVTENIYLEVLGFKKVHYGLFSHIVEVDKEQSFFSHITKNNKSVRNYWNKKEKEKKLLIKSRERSAIEKKEADIFLCSLREKLGVKPKRYNNLTKFLNNNITEAAFNLFLTDPDLKSGFLLDIDYRLLRISLKKSIPTGSLAHCFFSCSDYKYEFKLVQLKKHIEDYSTSSNFQSIAVKFLSFFNLKKY